MSFPLTANELADVLNRTANATPRRPRSRTDARRRPLAAPAGTTHRRTLVVHGRIDSPRIQWVAYPDPVRYTTAAEAHRDQHRAALRVITSYGLAWESGTHGVNYITVECSDGDCPLDLARAAGLIR